MNFDELSRARLVPAAILAAPCRRRRRQFGRPGAAQGAHRRRPDDDRRFRPDRRARPLGRRHAAAQAARQGPLPIWQRRPAAGRERQDADLRRLSGRPEIELAARPHAARRAAVELAGFQRQGPDPAERRLACRRRPCARHVAIWIADAGCSCAAPRRRAACSFTAGPRSTRRTIERRSNCRMSATMSRCRTARSPTPSRRSAEVKKVSFCDLFIAMSGAAPIYRSDSACPGFPPVTRVCGIPCVTNAWSALAPCPRSGGLFLDAHRQG